MHINIYVCIIILEHYYCMCKHFGMLPLCCMQDEWLECQRNWLYLESIFGAPDIQRQLPNEAKMFSQVDKSWKEVMRRVHKFPNCIKSGTHPGEQGKCALHASVCVFHQLNYHACTATNRVRDRLGELINRLTFVNCCTTV